MGSIFLKMPEMAITQDEAKVLGSALADVQEAYGIEVLDEKKQALVNLVTAMGTVYGPRLAAAVIERKKRGPQKVPATPVVQFHEGVM
jgi:hypothetical protein